MGTFHTPDDAGLAERHLRKKGIESRIDEGNVVVGMTPLWDPALGAVRLLVSKTDHPRAKRLIEKFKRRLAKQRDPELYTETHEPDAVAARAFRAAVLGFFCAPVALHIYSLILLSELRMQPLSKAGERNRRAALIVNWTTLAGAAALAFWTCSR